jgi:hypothetical protein
MDGKPTAPSLLLLNGDCFFAELYSLELMLAAQPDLEIIFLLNTKMGLEDFL